MEEPPRSRPVPLRATRELSLYSLMQRRFHLTEAPSQNSLLCRETSALAAVVERQILALPTRQFLSRGGGQALKKNVESSCGMDCGLNLFALGEQ